MQDMNAFNLQLQSIKGYCFDILHKTLNTDIWNYIYIYIYIYTLKVKLKLPVGGRKSLLISESLQLNRIIKGWFIQEQHSVMLLRDTNWNYICW